MEKRDSNHIGDSRTVNLSGDTLIVFAPKENDTTRQKGSVGQTIKGLTAWVGSMMSRGVRWLAEARSYEITGVNILLSGFLLSVFLGFCFGFKVGISRTDEFKFMDKFYRMEGMAEVPGNPGVYLTVYKERQ